MESPYITLLMDSVTQIHGFPGKAEQLVSESSSFSGGAPDHVGSPLPSPSEME